jgi:hypothetical protein
MEFRQLLSSSREKAKHSNLNAKAKELHSTPALRCPHARGWRTLSSNQVASSAEGQPIAMMSKFEKKIVPFFHFHYNSKNVSDA